MAASAVLDPIKNVKMLTGAQRAAILVMYLEPDAAKLVLNELSTPELQELGTTMASVDAVDPSVIEEVVGEFVKALYERAMVPKTGRDFALGVMPELIDEQRRERVVSTIRRNVSTEFQEYIAGRPARTVATLLRDEHPQTQAVALILMGPENAAALMEYFDDREQLELALRMPAIESVPAELADDVERAMRESLSEQGSGIWAIEGLDEAARILGRLGRPLQEPLMGQIEAFDADLSGVLRNRMVRFEDLDCIDDRNMQQLLKNIERGVLLPALRGAMPQLRELFLANMSSRAADDLRDEIEIMGKVPKSEVEAAQAEIVQVALQMRDEGTLQLALGGGDDMV